MPSYLLVLGLVLGLVLELLDEKLLRIGKLRFLAQRENQIATDPLGQASLAELDPIHRRMRRIGLAPAILRLGLLIRILQEQGRVVLGHQLDRRIFANPWQGLEER